MDNQPTKGFLWTDDFHTYEEETTLNSFYKIFQAAYGSEKTFIPTCFYIYSLFRNISNQHSTSNAMLFIKGNAATGKTSVTNVINAMQSKRTDPISLESISSWTLTKQLDEHKMLPIVCLDSYSKHSYTLEDILKPMVYDGRSLNKRTDDGIEFFRTYSSIIINSQVMPTDETFASRCVVVDFGEFNKPVHTSEFEASKVLFDMIQKLVDSNSLSVIETQLKAFETDVETNYKVVFKQLRFFIMLLLHDAQIKVETRMINNITQLLTPAMILHQYGRIKMFDLPESMTYQRYFAKVAVHSICEQIELMNNNQ